MMNRTKRLAFGLIFAGIFVAVPQVPRAQTQQPACDSDNGGITLPDGFCAAVVADGLGTARHIEVAANGDVYVSLQKRRQRRRSGGAACQ